MICGGNFKLIGVYNSRLFHISGGGMIIGGGGGGMILRNYIICQYHFHRTRKSE